LSPAVSWRGLLARSGLFPAVASSESLSLSALYDLHLKLPTARINGRLLSRIAWHAYLQVL
jgi:hypothetical protein